MKIKLKKDFRNWNSLKKGSIHIVPYGSGFVRADVNDDISCSDITYNVPLEILSYDVITPDYEIGYEEQASTLWMKPDALPVVELGEEKEFWVAVESTRPNKESRVICFLAMYLNKPLAYEDEEPMDYCLVDESGDSIGAVGWHNNRSHYDFDNFYEPLVFDEDYELLAWAEYTPPQFCGAID